MALSKRNVQLLEFVKLKHGNQKRKYTGEPYWTHLQNVADIIETVTSNQWVIAIGLCHDLFEDTDCTEKELRLAMQEIGFSFIGIRFVIKGVKALTDVYTKEAYPSLNRRKRKALEAERLGKINEYFQTAKYADLIDNTTSIKVSDPNFWKIYREEKVEILKVMRKGDPILLSRAEAIL